MHRSIILFTSILWASCSARENQAHQNLRKRRLKRASSSTTQASRHGRDSSVKRLRRRNQRIVRRLSSSGASPSPGFYSAYTSAFEHLTPHLFWPLPNSHREYISSTFGPRLLNVSTCPNGGSAEHCYDFHPGIDIEGSIGDPVVAVLNGTVARVTSMSCGGLVVEVEHEFDRPVQFRGAGNDTIDHPLLRWYSRYHHLSSTSVYEGQQVEANEEIALVGNSGNCAEADTPLLHFEIILSNSNLQTSFDARIHPFHAFPRGNLLHWRPILIQQSDVAINANGIIEIQTRDVQPNVYRIEVQILRESDQHIKASHIIDLNLRQDFVLSNPTSPSYYPNMMYTPDTSVPHLLPAIFDESVALWMADLVIPSSWVSSVPVFLMASGVPETLIFKVSVTDTRLNRVDITGPIASVN